MNEWPMESEAPAFYGPVGVNQVKLILPFPMKLAWDNSQVIEAFHLHELVYDSANRAFHAIKDHYGPEEIERLRLDQFGGCLNVRKKRGGNSWSMHAWGAAIDFDPENNQLNWGRDKATLAGDEYLPFWEIWESEGWASLGRKHNFDWMHVQATQ